MKSIEYATLDDVGQEVEVLFQGIYRHTTTIGKTISMMIKAPRGRLVLFELMHQERNNPYRRQAKAVKLFMQQHRKDK